MLPAHFFTSGLLNLGILLQGLARRVFRFRKLPIVRLKPSLSSPPPIHLLEAPIAPLERLVEEFRTPSSSGGLIVTEGPPLVQPSPIPTRSFQSSLVTVTPNRIPNLVPFLLLLIFISGFLLLLPGLVYVRASIANRISAICRRQSRKFSKASSFKPVSSLVLVFSLVPNFFSTLIFSRHLVSLVSLLLLWTGPLAIASFFTFIYIIYVIFKFKKFSNMIVSLLQRCGLLTQLDTQTPPVLNAIYEQIVNKTVTYNKFIWRSSSSTPPTGPKEEQTPTSTGVVTRSQLDTQLQYLEQELLIFLTLHKLELEEEKQHRLRAQRIYSEFLDSQKSLRRQLEVSRAREGELRADLQAAEAKRAKLKGFIATLEASGAALRSDLTAADNESRDAAKMVDRLSKLAAEKDRIIRSTTNDLLAVRTGLRDAEDNIARLNADLQSERDLRIRKENELLNAQARLRDAKDEIARLDTELRNERNLRTSRMKELVDEQTKARSLHRAEMRRIAKKAEEAQKQLDLLDDVLSESRDRTQSLLDHAHPPRLKNHAIAIKPDDTGQPPPPLLEPIPAVHTPRLDPVTEYRSPFSPKSLRQTPEHDPPTRRHSPDYPRQISACFDRVSDIAHPPRLKNHAIAIKPDDTGQPPPPLLEPIPAVHTPRLDPITEYRSPFSPKSQRQTPEHDPPTRRHSPDHSRQISACFDRVSDIAASWRARLRSLLETIHRLEAERALQAESRELSEPCLQEELAATKDQLRAMQEELTETKDQLRAAREDASNAHRKIDLGRKMQQDTWASVEHFKRELETCRGRLKAVQDSRRESDNKCSEAVEQLRLRNADLESLRAEAEASQSKHSQAVSLSAALRKRVKILEAEVKSLKRNQKCAEMHPADSQTADTDPIPTPHSTDNQTQDSFHMKLSSSMPYLLDCSLPPSLSPSSVLFPTSSDQLHTISLDNVPLDLDPPQRPDIFSTRHPPPSSGSEIPSSSSWTRRCSVGSLPVGSSVGSVGWPPTGSALRPSGKNPEPGSGVNKTPQSPLQEADNQSLAWSTSRNPSNSPLKHISMNSPPFVFGDPSRQFGVHFAVNQYWDLTHPFGSNVADDPMRLTAADLLGTRRSPQSASVACARLPSSSRLHPEVLSGSDHHHSVETHALNCSITSTPQSPTPGLLPGFLDSVLLREHALRYDDSPCAFRKLRNRPPDHYQTELSPGYIPTLDYGLPEDFIPGNGCVAPKRFDRGLDVDFAEDFAFIIPLDCLTSTPVAISRKLSSKWRLPEPSVSFGHSRPGLTPPPRPKIVSRLIN